MQQNESASSHAGRDDLELPRPGPSGKRPDLVASLVHVSREGKLPLLSTSSSARTDSSPTQQLQHSTQHLTQHQYVVPQGDRQHHLQVSQIATIPSTNTWISSSISTPENARLAEPFSPAFPLYDAESEEKSLTPINPSSGSAAIATTTTTTPQSAAASPNTLDIPPLSPNGPKLVSVVDTPPKPKSKMFFGELQRTSTAAHRRRSMATTGALTDYEADLTSKDRIKQKEAIRRVLAVKVREDWSWTWPRDGDEPGTPIVNRSQESLVEEDWKEREEWVSNVSESEDESGATIGSPTVLDASNSKDPFRFDSPDGVGDTLRKTAEDRKSRRRRRLQDEMKVNDGLSCFIHRRNAWTCARHVRRKPRASPNAAPLKRTLSRPTSRPSPAAPAPSIPSQEDDLLDMITEIRIAPPILPPETPMRKGINERAYSTIYDKVILQSQTPLCPINLSVITKSCVEGWKRDGEWPPKSGEMEAIIASVRRAGLGAGGGGSGRAEAGKDGLAGSKSKSVLRRSLQKVMGAVRERAGSKGKDEELVLNE